MNFKEIKEQIEEILFQTKEKAIYLYEMSLPQAKVMTNVRNLSEPIFEHTMKIILYGIEEERTLHHWCHELNNWLLQCVKNNIKRKRKDTPPTEKELYKWLTDYYSGVEDVIGTRQTLEQEYIYQGHKKRTCTDDQIYNNIISFYKEICPLITQRQNTDDKVEEIIRKYRLA